MDANHGPTAALRTLALGVTPEQRKRGWMALFAFGNAIAPPAEVERRMTAVIEEVWRGAGDERPALVEALARVVLTDPGLLTIEIAAWGLALEGEDGATELLSMARHRDFSIRSKVAIAFGQLGRSARWAVPALLRHLENEPVEYVAGCLIRTLGRVGGREATGALERIAAGAIAAMEWDLAKAAREALAEAAQWEERR